MRSKIEKRAIWIFDEYFLLPGLLSICSFYEHHEMPGTIYYCETDNNDVMEHVLSSIPADIDIRCIQLGAEYQEREDYKTIMNRLVRMHVMKTHNTEVVYLFDADVLFGASITPLIEQADIAINENGINILGHYEEQIAHHSFLYFQTPLNGQYEYSFSSQTEHDLYTECFGPQWPALIGTPGYNNGVLVFHDCAGLADSWESIYRKGLNYPMINASDDQLPLVAACNLLRIKKGSFDKIYNSLGELNPPFIIYHAFSNAWKSQIYNAVHQEFKLSGYASIASKFLKYIPSQLLDSILDDYKVEQYGWHYSFPDRCKYLHLLKDSLTPLENGNIAVVGTTTIQSLVYAAEYILKNKKSVLIDAIYNAGSGYTKEEYQDLMEELDTTKAGSVLESHMDLTTLDYHPESLDFVFINSSCDPRELQYLLEFFYPFIKPGGLLAGYDYGAQDGLNFGGTSGSFAFAKENHLCVSIDFNIFLIPKPGIRVASVPQNEELFFHKTIVT